MPKETWMSLSNPPSPSPTGDDGSHQRKSDTTADKSKGLRPKTRNGSSSGGQEARSKTPQSPSSPVSTGAGTAHSKTSQPSVKMIPMDLSSEFLDPPDPPYGKSQNSSSTSLNNSHIPDAVSVTSSSVQESNGAFEEEGPSGSWKSSRSLARSESQDAVPTKKSTANRRMFQLLSRAHSIKTSENGTEPPVARSSRPRQFAKRLGSRDHLAKEKDAPQTAPLEPEPGFREMTTSRRNRSADRAQKDEEDQRAGKPGGPNAFLSNIMSSSSRAAGEIRGAGKGLFGKFYQQRAPAEKYANLDNYRFKIINLPLIEQTRVSRVAKSMGDAYDKTQYWMPSLPYRCIEYLNLHGTEEEGLYRLSGSAREIKRWQVKFDTGPDYDVHLLNQEDLHDINAISSMFKAWLRELPDEILPKSVQDRVAERCAAENTTETPQLFRDELSSLPPHNYYLLFAITCHISLLHSNREKNKMNYQNLCICFQPCMKMDALCFQFLVCDWRNCWQGCWTEQEYLAKEQEALDALEEFETNDSTLAPSFIAVPVEDADGSHSPDNSSRPTTDPSQGSRSSDRGKTKLKLQASQSEVNLHSPDMELQAGRERSRTPPPELAPVATLPPMFS